MTNGTHKVEHGHYTEWWLGQHRHREDGPACVFNGVYSIWYRHGIQHREDGPSYENIDGYKNWCLFGKHFTEEEYLKRVYHD